MLTCSSPKLFAAYHVLHRQLVPWHPPCALISFIFLTNIVELFVSLASIVNKDSALL